MPATIGNWEVIPVIFSCKSPAAAASEELRLHIEGKLQPEWQKLQLSSPRNLKNHAEKGPKLCRVFNQQLQQQKVVQKVHKRYITSIYIIKCAKRAEQVQKYLFLCIYIVV